MPSRRSAYAVLSMTWVVVVASQAVTDVSNESELRAALQAARPQGSDVLNRIRLSTTIFLNSTLDINASHGRLELTGGGLYLSRCDHGVPVLRFQGAVGVTLQGVTVTLPCARNPTFAIEAIGSADVKISRSRIVGGIRIADSLRPIVERCDVSNPWGAGGGSCVNIATCGNATTLVGCGAAVRQTEIHDCRANGGSPYAPGAQGVLLGGPEGSAQCTVGVIVEHNFVHSIDEMGIRVSNNNYYPCVNNQVVFNRVQDWGQLPASGGGDNTDSGALYMYGHWYSPGNNFSFNYALCTNASWGQNGLYFDDAASGNVAVGNVFANCSGGSSIKLNGGSFNTFDSILTVGSRSLGFGNCRGLRGTPQQRYTCANEQRWMQILESVDYLGGAWAEAFPWYRDWCNGTTVNGHACAPQGAPADYDCAVLSHGNSVDNLAGAYPLGRDLFSIQSAPGFPDSGTGDCPQFVVNESFSDVAWAHQHLYAGPGLFVDAAAGNYTLLPGAAVYADMPAFVHVPFWEIGVSPAAAAAAASGEGCEEAWDG